LGPRDLDESSVLLAPRVGELDDRGRVVKQAVKFEELMRTMGARLDDYHDLLVARAEAFRDERSAIVDSWDGFAAQVGTGFAMALHCGRPECEDEIKEDSAATPRCVPIDGEAAEGSCVRCGQDSAYGKRVVFARAY
jgi:prolyl-tRNA synthetase